MDAATREKAKKLLWELKLQTDDRIETRRKVEVLGEAIVKICESAGVDPATLDVGAASLRSTIEEQRRKARRYDRGIENILEALSWYYEGEDGREEITSEKGVAHRDGLIDALEFLGVSNPHSEPNGEG